MKTVSYLFIISDTFFVVITKNCGAKVLLFFEFPNSKDGKMGRYSDL